MKGLHQEKQKVGKPSLYRKCGLLIPCKTKLYLYKNLNSENKLLRRIWIYDKNFHGISKQKIASILKI